MSETERTSDLLRQVQEALGRTERRFTPITSPRDFLATDEGLTRLDGISMMLIVIGENLKNVDKATGGVLLRRYAAVDWKGAKGIRDVLLHHYTSVDPQIVYNICRDRLPLLATTIQSILDDF